MVVHSTLAQIKAICDVYCELTLETNFFCSKGAFDYCSNLGGVLASPGFFDLYNIGETPRRTTANNTSSIDKESNIIQSSEKITFEFLSHLSVGLSKVFRISWLGWTN